MTDISEGDDAWDDELLIQEYERSVQLVEERIEEIESKTVDNGVVHKETMVKKIGGKKNKNKKKEDTKEPLWMPGDPCIAVFKEDGQQYEANIVTINQNLGTCVVKYIGYENEEEQYLQELRPSKGVEAQISQDKVAKMFATIEANNQANQMENNDANVQKEMQDEKTGNDFRPEFILPPPPNFLATNPLGEPPSKEDDALASMLMSWYMCGYQTGYYTAMKQK